MPVKGGGSGKAGDQYELLWAVQAIVEIVVGRAEWIVYKSLDPDESVGVEFLLRAASGETQFWSVKR